MCFPRECLTSVLYSGFVPQQFARFKWKVALNYYCLCEYTMYYVYILHILASKTPVHVYAKLFLQL